MCVACLRTQVIELLLLLYLIHFIRLILLKGFQNNPLYISVVAARGKQCIIIHLLCIHSRYLQPPSTWISCVLESRELLSLCLKRLKGLSKVHLVDAGFIWTEPHSKRLKVKLTIQKEVNSIR